MISINKIPMFFYMTLLFALFFSSQIMLYAVGELTSNPNWNVIQYCITLFQNLPNLTVICISILIVVTGFFTIRWMIYFFHILYFEIKWHTMMKKVKDHDKSFFIQTKFTKIHVPINVIQSEKLLAMAKGFFKPKIYISTGLLERFQIKEIEAVLYHEQYHCIRKDPLKKFVANWIEKGFGYIPLIHSIIQYFTTYQEIKADQYSIGKMGTAEHIGKVLLQLSRVKNRMIKSTVVAFAEHAINLSYITSLRP